MTDETHRKSQTFDPLDMGNYRIEKLPKKQKSRVERLLQRIGLPIAVLAFILIYWVADIPFINQLSTEAQTTTLTSSAMDRNGQIKDAIFKQLKMASAPAGEQMTAAQEQPGQDPGGQAFCPVVCAEVWQECVCF